MPLIFITGVLLTVYVATREELSGRDKFFAVVILGIVCGVASLF